MAGPPTTANERSISLSLCVDVIHELSWLALVSCYALHQILHDGVNATFGLNFGSDKLLESADVKAWNYRLIEEIACLVHSINAANI